MTSRGRCAQETEKAAGVRDFFGKGNGSCRQDRDDCHLAISVPSALSAFVHPFTPANASVRTRLHCYKRIFQLV
jgi:hypothetical protein